MPFRTKDNQVLKLRMHAIKAFLFQKFDFKFSVANLISMQALLPLISQDLQSSQTKGQNFMYLALIFGMNNK